MHRDWLWLLTLSLLWGGSFILVELALAGLPALTVVWGRVAGAAALLALWLRLTGLAFPARRHWPALAVMGLLNNAAPFTLFVLAQGRIEGALAAIVNATTPLWTVLVAHAFTSDERLTPAKTAALALGFAGVLIMTGGAAGGEAQAISACLGAALCYGLAGVWGRRFRATDLVPAQVAVGMLTASTLMLTPVWALLDRPLGLNWPGLSPLAALAALSILSTALAYLIYFRLLARAGATFLSLVTFLIPASALAMGVGFLGERLEARHLAGLALILAGLAAMERGRRAWRG